jgi:hypothetical protein
MTSKRLTYYETRLTIPFEFARTLWLDLLKAEEFLVIIVTPPGNSWSRLVWLNNFGPKPCRSRNHPRGFPWADKGSVSRRHAKVGNIWVDFLIAVLVIVRDLNNDLRFTLVLAEHPEDLGFSEDIRPASNSYWICASQLQFGAVLAPSTNACIAAQRSSCTAISPNPHVSYQTRKRSLHWGMLAGLRFQLLEPTKGPFRAHAAIDIMAALYANAMTRLFAPVVLLLPRTFGQGARIRAARGFITLHITSLSTVGWVPGERAFGAPDEADGYPSPSRHFHALGAPDDDKSGASPARHMAPITRESRQSSHASWCGHERSASKETRASLSTYFLSTVFPSSRPNESSQNYATSVRARGVDHNSAFVYHTSSVQTSSGPGERSLHRPHTESEQPLHRKRTGVHGAVKALSRKSPPVPWALKIHLDFDSGQ